MEFNSGFKGLIHKITFQAVALRK